MHRSICRILFIALCAITFSTTTFAQGKFVYTNNDRETTNSISGFKVKADATLELLPGFPTGTDGGGGTPDTRVSNDKIAITERGPFLFASSDGDQEVASYHLNPNTGALTFIGTIKKMACVTTLEHNTPERRMLAKVDPGVNKGNASFQSPPGTLKCTIIDKDITNNTALCP